MKKIRPKKASAAKLRSWRVTILRNRAHYLGDVQAPDEGAAEAAAVSEFKLSDEQRKRLVVRERDWMRAISVQKSRGRNPQRGSPTEPRCPKKIAEATGNSKIESRRPPFWGPPIGQSSFSIARIFVEAFVGD
jgi:hypothetical protein